MVRNFKKENQQWIGMWELSKVEEIVNGFSIRGKATDTDWQVLEFSPSYISNNINVFKKKKTWLCNSAVLGQIKGFSGQSRFDARYWMLGASALGRPRGMVWGGRREEGSGGGTHVYLWRIHFDIWQN